MDPLSALLSSGGGGLSVAPSSSASTGPAHIGGFVFSPKSSTLPPVAWIAIAAAAAVALVVLLPRRRS